MSPTRSRSLAQAVLEASADGIVVVDREGIVLRCNPAAEHLLGRTADELVGEQFGTPAAGGRSVGDTELRIVRPDGARRIVELRTAETEWDGRMVTVVALRDLTGERRARRKLEETEEELRRAGKLEAVARLAGGVAHDFNNLLVAILGHADLLDVGLPDGHRLREEVDGVRTAARRCAELTRRLLAFSRRETMEPRPVSLSEVVRSAVAGLDETWDDRVRLKLELAPDLQPVMADPDPLGRLVVNLIENAREASPPDGTVVVRTERHRIESPSGLGPPGRTAPVEPGRYVRLSVVDAGEGMDRATLERAFDPFFTTREPGRGRGLGLSTVYGVVRQAGGHLHVESAPDEGTSVRVLLPVADP